MTPERPTRRIARLIGAALGVGFVLTAYGVIGTHFRRVGLMVPDESYFTLAARSVFEGRLPYRDFAYMQMPFLPYVNGLALELTGYGLDNHRLVSFVWGGCGLVMLIASVRQRLGSFEPALLAAIAVAASPRWGFLQAMGSWCGVAGMFLNLALAAAIWRGDLRWRTVVFAVAGTLSIGCRLSGAPVVALLAAILVLEAPGLAARVKTLALCLAVGVVSIAPFALVAPDEFFFMNWTFHMESTADRPIGIRALQAWDVAPAAIVLQAVGLVGVVSLVRRRLWSETVLLGAGLVGLIAPMIPASSWGTYISSSVPIAAAAGVISIWETGMFRGNPHRHALWALPLMSLFHMTPLEVPEGAATEVEELAAYVTQEVEEGPLLTPAGIIAVEAGRDVIPGTEMGKFSAMDAWEKPRADRYHMTTLPDLTAAVEEQLPAAIVLVVEPIGWRVWNFQWALPTWDMQPLEYITDFEEKVDECYRPVWRTSTMELYVRRDESGGGDR